MPLSVLSRTAVEVGVGGEVGYAGRGDIVHECSLRPSEMSIRRASSAAVA